MLVAKMKLKDGSIKLPPDAFHQLHDDTSSISARNKLARYLWKFSSTPNNEQSILNWITTTITSQFIISSNEDLNILWSTLADFLNSEELIQYLNSFSQDIFIKSSFVKTYTDSLAKLPDEDILTDLLDIGSLLISHKRISSGLRQQFLSVLKFMAAWEVNLTKLLQTDASSNLCLRCVAFMKEVLKKVQTLLDDHNHSRKMFDYFVENCFCSSLQLYGTVKSIETFQDDTLIEMLENVLKSGLFSRKNKVIFDKSSASKTEGKLRKPEKLVVKLWTQVDTAIKSKQDANKMGLAHLYCLFLDAYNKCEAEMKFHFFTSILKFLDLEKSSNNVEVLAQLLKLNLEHNLYQPGVDRDFAKEQSNCYKQVVEKLINIRCDVHWASCIATIATIDLASLDMNIVLKKILQDTSDKNAWVCNFFTVLVQTHQEIRQPLLLVKCFLDSLCVCCQGKEPSSADQSYIAASQVFAASLALHCIALCPHNTTLDIWEVIQDKLRHHTDPNKKEISENKTPLSVKNMKSKKRKIAVEDDVPVKKMKMEDPYSALQHCLIILLCEVVRESHLLDIVQQISARTRLYQLMEAQCDVINILYDSISNTESRLTGSLINLMITRGQIQMILLCYHDKGSSCSLPSFNSFEKLMKSDVLLTNNTTYNSIYHQRNLLCFKVKWFLWVLTYSDSSNVHNQEMPDDEMKATLQTSVSSFVECLRSSYPLTSSTAWNGNAERIESQEKLHVATLKLLLNHAHVFLIHKDSNLCDEIAKIVVRSPFDSNNMVEKVFTENNILKNMFESSIFHEAANLHTSILEHLISFLLDLIKEFPKKKYKHFTACLKFASSLMKDVDHMDKDRIVETVNNMFIDSSKKSSIAKILQSAIYILSRLPLDNLPPNQASVTTLITLYVLASVRRKDTIKAKCIDIIDQLAASPKNRCVLNILPFNIMMSYYASSSSLSSTSEASLRRIVGNIAKSMFFNPTKENFNCIDQTCDLMRKSSDSSKETSLLLSASILLEHSSYILLKHDRLCSVSKYVYTYGNQGSVESNVSNKFYLKVVSRPLKNLPNPSKDEEKLAKCVEAVKKMLEVCSGYITKICTKELRSSTNIELIKSCLLGYFALDVQENSPEKKSRVMRFFNQIDAHDFFNKQVVSSCSEEESDEELGSLKFQLLLLYSELQVFYRRQKMEKLCSMSSESRRSMLLSLIELYSSSIAGGATYARLLLDRLIVLNMWFLPSADEYKVFFQSILKLLRESDDTTVVTSQLTFIQLLASCYDVKLRKFENISEESAVAAGNDDEDAESKPSTPILFEHIKFFRDSLDGAGSLIEGMTQGFPLIGLSQSYITLFPTVLSTISKILCLGPGIIKARQVPVAFEAVVRIDQHAMCTTYADYFLDVFSSISETVNAILNHHKEAVPGVVPLILSVCRKLLICTMYIGRQPKKGDEENKISLADAHHCAQYIERICQSISSNYASYFKRCVAYLIADYAHGLTNNTVKPLVKKPLQTSMYYLVSLCDEYSVAMLKTTLRPGVREVFRKFYMDYVKYFKYTGRV